MFLWLTIWTYSLRTENLSIYALISAGGVIQQREYLFFYLFEGQKPVSFYLFP